jgi:hypothetical protein
MELTLGSETSAFKTQTPGNNPEDYTLDWCTHFPRVNTSLPVLYLTAGVARSA